ncbi:MAG: hypothetical protein HQK63_02070 [Desulfamplus sp.]|nr:hypothetical protein [Desulfamplus sp.]
MSHSSSLDSNKQKIKKTVEEINAEQSDKKTRVLLTYEIKNREKEITFLTSKISMIQKEIQQIDSSIDSLGSVVKNSKSQLSDTLKINGSNANGWSELQKMQKDIQNMLSALPQLKSQISQKKKDIQEFTQTLTPLEDEWRQISEEKGELDESFNKANITLSSLEGEISVMRETKGLLYGILPQGYDTNLVDDISINFEACIQSYYNELEANIAQVKEKTEEMERQIEFEENLLKQIKPEKVSLEREAQRVLDNAMLDESTLSVELEQMQSQHQALSSQNSNLTEDIDGASLQIKDIEGSIKTKQNIHHELKNRYEALLELKSKVDKIDDIEAELRHIKTMSWQAKSEYNVSNSMLSTINSIKSDLTSMNDRLKAVYVDFNKQLEIFDAAVGRV